MLSSLSYEDEDSEDLNATEMRNCMKLYDQLLEKYAAAKGRSVTASDDARELEEMEEEEAGPTGGNGSSKGKGKGKAKKGDETGADAKMVGSRVRKFFEDYDEEFDGKVKRIFLVRNEGMKREWVGSPFARVYHVGD